MKTYIEKEKDLITALKSNNWSSFTDAKDACEFIGDALAKLPAYANVVIRQAYMGPIWNATLEGQAYRDAVQTCDRQRRIAHDSAISAIDIMNRLCEKNNCGKFIDVDTSDRYAVADAVGEYVLQLYGEGTHGGMYQATKNRGTQYDTSAAARRVMAIAEELEGRAADSGMEMMP